MQLACCSAGPLSNNNKRHLPWPQGRPGLLVSRDRLIMANKRYAVLVRYSAIARRAQLLHVAVAALCTIRVSTTAVAMLRVHGTPAIMPSMISRISMEKYLKSECNNQ